MNRYLIIDRQTNIVTNTCHLEVLTNEEFFDEHGSSITYPNKEFLISNEVEYLIDELDNLDKKIEIAENLLKKLNEEKEKNYE